MSTTDVVRRLMRRRDVDKILALLSEALEKEQSARTAFWERSDEDTRAEWILGRVWMLAPPTFRHSQIGLNLLMALHKGVDENGGRLTTGNVLVVCGRCDFMPDMCYWGPARAGEIGMDEYMFPAPDFVIEILSKSTEKIDRGLKMDTYAAAGVQEYWLADPRNLAIETYYLGQDGYFAVGSVYKGRAKCPAA